MELTDRFKEAVLFATTAHHGQTRKGTQIPYISHLMTVAAIVLDHGGNEDEAIGALLHAGPGAGLSTLGDTVNKRRCHSPSFDNPRWTSENRPGRRAG